MMLNFEYQQVLNSKRSSVKKERRMAMMAVKPAAPEKPASLPGGILEAAGNEILFTATATASSFV